MRQDQIDDLKPQYTELTDAILVALLSELGVKSISDVLPNPDELIEGMIKSAYGEGFTEKDVDAIIKFHKKYEKKNKLAQQRSQQFIEKYFEDKSKEIEDHLKNLKGE